MLPVWKHLCINQYQIWSLSFKITQTLQPIRTELNSKLVNALHHSVRHIALFQHCPQSWIVVNQARCDQCLNDNLHCSTARPGRSRLTEIPPSGALFPCKAAQGQGYQQKELQQQNSSLPISKKAWQFVPEPLRCWDRRSHSSNTSDVLWKKAG